MYACVKINFFDILSLIGAKKKYRVWIPIESFFFQTIAFTT